VLKNGHRTRSGCGEKGGTIFPGTFVDDFTGIVRLTKRPFRIPAGEKMRAIRAPGSFVAHSFGGMSDEWNYLVTCATYEIREATMPNPSQYKGRSMISIPVAVHTALFKWQLDLFWFNHQLTYGGDAGKKTKAKNLFIIFVTTAPRRPAQRIASWC
jgi:hypothetical protein